MARQIFAGDLAAFTSGLVNLSTIGGPNDVLQLRRNVTGIAVWDSLAGGTQLTNLTDLGGTPITGVASDGSGLFAFQGPDEVYEVWLDAGFGTRQYVGARLATKVLANASTLAALQATVTANAAAALPLATVDAKGDLLAATADNAVARVAVGANGRVLTADSTASAGVSWQPFGREAGPFSVATLAVSSGVFKWRNLTGVTLNVKRICAQVGTAPVGQAIILDVLINGVSIFASDANRPQIAAGATESSIITANMTDTTVAAGERLTVDIKQIGTTTAGANLVVQIALEAA